MKRLSILACLLGGLLPAGAAIAAPGIVPGQSVGKVSLGMRHATVIRLLGAPLHARTLRSSKIPGLHPAGHYVVDEWTKKTTALTPVLTVTLRNDRVVQIETSSPRFSTADDVSIKTPFSTLRHRYPHMRVEEYSVAVEGFTEYQNFYMDSIRRGIAFTMGAQDTVYDGLPGFTPNSIIVHLPGQRVLPVLGEPGSVVNPPDASDTSDSMPNVRAWFAGGPHRRDIHQD